MVTDVGETHATLEWKLNTPSDKPESFVVTCVHCKKCGVTERSRGAIFSCFHGNSVGYHGNKKILLPWGIPIHHIFYSVPDEASPHITTVNVTVQLEELTEYTNTTQQTNFTYQITGLHQLHLFPHSKEMDLLHMPLML